MWHGAWYFKTLQTLLSKRGFSSYALDLPSARGCFAAELLRRAVSALTELRQLGQLQQVVLLGHSQGGILLQTLLRGTALEDASLHVQGAVLSATVPISSLGAGMAMMSHKTNVFKEYGLVAFVYYLFTGRVWDASLVQRLFLLPTTEAVEGFDGGKAKYVEKILAAPCDGWPTTEHPFWLRPSFAHRASLPVLVLGAEEDVIYPPRLLNPIFHRYFPCATERIVPNQAHCFIDPGWQETMVEPLIQWLDSIQ